MVSEAAYRAVTPHYCRATMEQDCDTRVGGGGHANIFLGGRVCVPFRVHVFHCIRGRPAFLALLAAMGKRWVVGGHDSWSGIALLSMA